MFVNLVFLTAGLAWAEVNSEAYQEMLRLSAEGHELYEAGSLEEAAEAYARAYESYPQAILLKNQMITRYLLDDCAEAIEFGRAFVERGEVPQVDRQDMEAVFAECSLDLARSAVSAKDKAQAEQWLDFGEDYFDENDLREDADELRQSLEATVADADEQDPDGDSIEDPIADAGGDDDGLGMSQVAGWSLVTVGSGVLVGATVWLFQGRAQFSELEQGVESLARHEELTDSINRARIAVPTLYAVGGLAAAAGVALVVLPALSNKEDQRVSIAPVVTPQMQGAVLRGRF